MEFSNYGNGVLVLFSEGELYLLKAIRRSPLSDSLDLAFGINSVYFREINSIAIVESLLAGFNDSETFDTILRGEFTILVDYSQGLDNVVLEKQLNLSSRELIDLHVGTIWEVALIGFAPGFPYLVPSSNGEIWNQISRLSSPRVKVPKGSIAVAAGLSSIYPNEMPGGWNVIGRTDFVLFDSSKAVPASLASGDRVYFKEVGSLC